jgi:hypothetical protein
VERSCAPLEAGAEERQQDLVALLSPGVETTQVLARLKLEALEAKIYGYVHEDRLRLG